MLFRSSKSRDQEALLKQSLAWNALSPRTAVELSRMLPLEQSTGLLRHSLIHSPENASLSWEIAKRFMNDNNAGRALYWIRRSTRFDVYNKDKRIKAIKGMLAMGQRKLIAGKQVEALSCIATADELLLQYRLLAISEATKGKQHNDRSFFLIPEQADDLSRRLIDMRVAANKLGEVARSLTRLSTKDSRLMRI